MDKKTNQIFYVVVALALLAIGYYSFAPGKQSPTVDKQPLSSARNDIGNQPEIQSSQSQTPISNTVGKDTSADQQPEPESSQSQTQPLDASANEQTAKTGSSDDNSANLALKIVKSEISSTARFYPYDLDGTSMEIIAVRASDGTIRTALNTCQVCYDSGRGYYKQVGDYLVCQNCGNRFHIDQVEKIKGGCNPIPILETDKQDMGAYIALSKDFLATQKQYFENWKRS